MKKRILSIIATLTIVFGAFASAPAYASGTSACKGGNNDPSCNKVCQDSKIPAETKQAAGCSMTTSDTLPSHVENIINVAISVVGILAVIVIVVGGQRMVTSSGDPVKVKQAKDMILYAGIALVIATLAYAIITFVGQAIGK
ncbi:hypothetical protein J6X90_01125 [Candidatus Saccharibacteria bacterium]|nr:hypothetical protein [Candidatus Saccharibacteria bacterium]